MIVILVTTLVIEVIILGAAKFRTVLARPSRRFKLNLS